QFCRYAKLVAALGARVILEVQKPLASLLMNLEGVTQLVGKGSALPAFDYHCPLLSLPLAFKNNLGNIPASAKYLSSDAAKITQWQARLGTKTKPRIGLVWSGNALHVNDRNRSIFLSDWVKELPTGFQYVSLQKEVRDADKQTLQAHTDILNFENTLNDFSDTAALCELMDVVISVDTSVAHLAGALGKPTFVLLPYFPDWRWLLDRSDSPWYPSVKLFRQASMGEWGSVLQNVNKEIELFH
ncbi:MAG: glycosyltransferase family 9 protein, partial [Burkholderiaceae bacterium]